MHITMLLYGASYGSWIISILKMRNLCKASNLSKLLAIISVVVSSVNLFHLKPSSIYGSGNTGLYQQAPSFQDFSRETVAINSSQKEQQPSSIRSTRIVPNEKALRNYNFDSRGDGTSIHIPILPGREERSFDPATQVSITKNAEQASRSGILILTGTSSPTNPSPIPTKGTRIVRKSKTKTPPDASIMVQLNGELGNHLSGIAQAFGLQKALERDHGLHVNLVLNRTDNKYKNYRWTKPKPREELETCFPNLRGMDFQQGRGSEATLRAEQQQNWLSAKQINMLRRINRHQGIGNKEALLQEGLEYYLKLLADPTRPSVPENATITVPFLSSTTLSSTFVVDHYYDEIRDFVTFDDEACCAMVPDPDESVFVSTCTYTQNPICFLICIYTRVSQDPLEFIQASPHLIYFAVTIFMVYPALSKFCNRSWERRSGSLSSL
jgi:hypothetical protein